MTSIVVGPAHQTPQQPFQSAVPYQSANRPIRILTVEAHPVFAEGLNTIIHSQSDMITAAHASNPVDAIMEFRRHRPDVTLMDFNLQGADGADLIVAIRRETENAKIVVLATSDSEGDIRRALRAGASSYMLKSMPKNEILQAIRTVYGGRKHIPSEVAVILAEQISREDLTERELEVLRLIRDGFRNKQIASELAIAETTVNFHIKNVMDKLRANDRTHAVTLAVRLGLVAI